jgi:hypothetical protein
MQPFHVGDPNWAISRTTGGRYLKDVRASTEIESKGVLTMPGIFPELHSPSLLISIRAGIF